MVVVEACQAKCRSAFLWELACLRCGHLGASGIPSRSLRRQASSHIGSEYTHDPDVLKCGSWVAWVGHSGGRVPIHCCSLSGYRSLSDRVQICFSVGAGLPAMRAPRCIRLTQLIPSQASQLPHLTQYTLCLMYSAANVGAGLLANAVGHSAFLSLIHRLLKQAHSHMDRGQPSEPQLMRGPPPPG